MGLWSARLAVAVVLAAAGLGALAGCDPVAGTGNGDPLPPSKALFVNAADHTAVLTLQVGYPAGQYQWNFNGYQFGAMLVTVPVGWTLQVECVNRGTVDNSCAVVHGAGETAPADPSWATPVLKPGQSASFSFVPTQAGSYRITDLVPAREAAGTWMRLVVVDGSGGSGGSAAPGAVPTISANAS